MALTSEDRQEIRQTVQDAVTSSIGPLVQRVTGMETRLYGSGQAAGDVGDLKGNVSSLFKRLNRVELLLMVLLGSGGVTGGSIAVIKLIGG